MTQDGGNASPFQGDREGFRALPLKSVESGISSSETVQKALWRLVRHGYIRQVKREKGSWTYLPGVEA